MPVASGCGFLKYKDDSDYSDLVRKEPDRRDWEMRSARSLIPEVPLDA